MSQPHPWNLRADLDGYVVEFHGEIVARARTFDAARRAYNLLRAHAAMARETLRHTLEGART